MSTQTIFATTIANTAAPNPERSHRIRLIIGYAIAIAMLAALLIYGFDYYSLNALQRPYSPKYRMLRPSGYIGIKLGILGFAMFCFIFLYAIRKRWPWLRKKGTARHWLDFHVLLGIMAPFVIALHASFKFQGVAGMAFWLMLSVAISGVVGRYLYGQIPRRVTSAELSMQESKELQQELTEKLKSQMMISESELNRLFHLPTQEQVDRWSIFFCMIYMVMLDIYRPFQIAKLRRRQLSLGESINSLGGLLATHHRDLEAAISVAREQGTLSKRILFLSRVQKVFELWHVVHKPFSYSFLTLAIVHIVVVVMLGYL